MRPDEMPPTPLDQLLDRVVKRGRNLRRRRLATPALLGAIILGALVPVATNLARPERPALVSGAGDAPAVVSSTSKLAKLSKGAPSPKTTRAIASGQNSEPAQCRNSFDQPCGAFQWDPAPQANRPISISITYEPADPVVGQEVTFTVAVQDPDAPHVGVYMWGDPSNIEAADRLCRQGYGPWTPPEPRMGRGTFTYSETYDRPGTYRFPVSAASSNSVNPSGEAGQGACQDPYSSDGREEISVTVRDAGPETSPTS